MDYIIGVDLNGYDGCTSSLCALKRLDDGSITVLDTFSTSDKGAFAKRLQSISEFYNITEDKIIYFSDNY